MRYIVSFELSLDYNLVFDRNKYFLYILLFKFGNFILFERCDDKILFRKLS